MSDDFYKEEGNFTQFSAVFNNQEIFPPGLGYDITCNSCVEHSMGETARALVKRLVEHQKQTISLVQEHHSKATHEID